MKIIKQTHNPLLGRYQVELEYEHFQQPVPKATEVLKEAAGILKASPETMKVKYIYAGYGEGKSRAVVYVYDTAEAFSKIEVFRKKVKKKDEKPAAKKET